MGIYEVKCFVTVEAADEGDARHRAALLLDLLPWDAVRYSSVDDDTPYELDAYEAVDVDAWPLTAVGRDA